MTKQSDMTHGNILRLLISFSVPLFLGNLLQQLYNAFDAIVVGNFVGNEALAAVGSAGVLINMIIAFFMGMSTGASVLISQAYGARDGRSLRDAEHTAVLLALIMGIALSALGIAATPQLLSLMRTPPEVVPLAAEYLRIYFAGMTALTVYNMGAAILTAVGDSKRPLYFLMISTVLNIIGNLAFVNIFHMGVGGVAWSTVIAEAVTAVLVILTLCRADGEYRLYLRDLRVHSRVVRRIGRLGLPGGVQQAIISLSNIIVQSYINGMGAIVLAGYIANSKLDAFIMLPTQTLALAVSTFVGQNLGAGQVKRARRGARISLMAGLAFSVAIAVLALIFGRYLIRIFTPDPAVADRALQFMRVFVPLYFLLCFTQIIPGALRGAGDVNVATLTCIISFVPIRQAYLYAVSRLGGASIGLVALSYPATWGLAAAVLLFYYFRMTDWSKFEGAGPAEGANAPKRESLEA
ncbi:MAG: MATE family efflux transporter [Clostridiales bacterium]|nr:MATE family efflux transporter [Clostridiales bacterium]